LQGEGPYYPVVDCSTYDNDLISTAADDEIVTPIMAFTLLNLNTASGDEFRTIPDVGDRMVREFEEYRPYISILQFRREIGKYVDEAQVAAYEAYVYVPIRVDESDAATLMQIPGVDETIAEALIAARPFGSNEAFVAALVAYLSPGDAAFAVNYLE
jgi:radical SAM superfamily enzyme with C-terminal helix-hairpin-helix motif